MHWSIYRRTNHDFEDRTDAIAIQFEIIWQWCIVFAFVLFFIIIASKLTNDSIILPLFPQNERRLDDDWQTSFSSLLFINYELKLNEDNSSHLVISLELIFKTIDLMSARNVQETRTLHLLIMLNKFPSLLSTHLSQLIWLSDRLISIGRQSFILVLGIVMSMFNNHRKIVSNHVACLTRFSQW